MPSSNASEQKPFSLKLVILALFAYSLVHLSPALPGASTSSFINNKMRMTKKMEVKKAVVKRKVEMKKPRVTKRRSRKMKMLTFMI
jgi:hypothetical protein